MANIDKKMIEDIVSITLAKLGKDGFPFCVVEATRVTQISEEQKRINKIVTGNGNPEDGIIYQFAQAEIQRKADHATLQELRGGIWAVALIGIGLIVTSIFQLIVK